MRTIKFIPGENAAAVKKDAQRFIAKRAIEEYAKVKQNEAKDRPESDKEDDK